MAAARNAGAPRSAQRPVPPANIPALSLPFSDWKHCGSKGEVQRLDEARIFGLPGAIKKRLKKRRASLAAAKKRTAAGAPPPPPLRGPLAAIALAEDIAATPSGFSFSLLRSRSFQRFQAHHLSPLLRGNGETSA